MVFLFGVVLRRAEVDEIKIDIFEVGPAEIGAAQVGFSDSFR
jgi:hypothetical protein